jgi:predicted transcriptional regulator of viral defense system
MPQNTTFMTKSTHNIDFVSRFSHDSVMSVQSTQYRKKMKKVASGELEKVAKGIYIRPEDLFGIEGDFYRATLVCGKISAICLGSALQYYGLSERLSGKTTILIPYNSSAPRNNRIRAIRSRNPQWKIGIVKMNRFKITSVERSIVDAFRYARLIGINEAVYALKVALKERQTTKAKIYDMARVLKAKKILLPYLESM